MDCYSIFPEKDSKKFQILKRFWVPLTLCILVLHLTYNLYLSVKKGVHPLLKLLKLNLNEPPLEVPGRVSFNKSERDQEWNIVSKLCKYQNGVKRSVVCIKILLF